MKWSLAHSVDGSVRVGAELNKRTYAWVFVVKCGINFEVPRAELQIELRSRNRSYQQNKINLLSSMKAECKTINIVKPWDFKFHETPDDYVIVPNNICIQTCQYYRLFWKDEHYFARPQKTHNPWHGWLPEQLRQHGTKLSDHDTSWSLGAFSYCDNSWRGRPIKPERKPA